jgi:cell volume regulation protein A
VHELARFGLIVFGVAAAGLCAIGSTRVAERIRIPAGALFLLGAAVASDLFPGLSGLSTKNVERIASVALAVILFDGGLRSGWRRVRRAWVPVVSLGLAGTFVMAGLMAVATRYALGFSWTTAGLIGAALAPTDPAIMFSVLGRWQITGRTGTILEGESGANDPVGIALMLALVDHAAGTGSIADGALGFLLSLAIGVVGGVIAGGVLHPLVVRLPVGDQSLGPLRTLTFALLVFGAASALHGSGFLAVYVAGLLIADHDYPGHRANERFHTSLASLAEIVVFVALGLTVSLGFVFSHGIWLDGLILTALVVLVARPLATWPLLIPIETTRNEEAFIVWAGLKGAVPILLASFALARGIADADRIYAIVFVVVTLSVTLQAATIPTVARRLRIPMEPLHDEPWA